MSQTKLTAEELIVRLAELDFWKVVNNRLMKRYKFPDFTESLIFVNKIGEIAETHDHHPDIAFGWGYAEIYLTTHDLGGISIRDIAVAKEVDRLTKN